MIDVHIGLRGFPANPRIGSNPGDSVQIKSFVNWKQSFWSTAVSNGCVLTLGNNFWHKFELIATKAAKTAKNSVREQCVEISIGWARLGKLLLLIKRLFEILLLKTTVHCFSKQQLSTSSQFIVLNYMFSFFTFQRLMISKKCEKRKQLVILLWQTFKSWHIYPTFLCFGALAHPCVWHSVGLVHGKWLALITAIV